MKKANLDPNVIPIIKTTNVCIVIGTGQNGTCIFDEKAKINVPRIHKIESEVKHDVIAFLTSVNEFVGDSGRYIHVGMTSSDVLDTGLSLQLKDSSELLLKEIEKLENEVRLLARKHKNTLMIGRSHAIHGEPISFGFKLAGWLAEIIRNKKRLLTL